MLTEIRTILKLSRQLSTELKGFYTPAAFFKYSIYSCSESSTVHVHNGPGVVCSPTAKSEQQKQPRAMEAKSVLLLPDYSNLFH